jgi:hypothetical protein
LSAFNACERQSPETLEVMHGAGHHGEEHHGEEAHGEADAHAEVGESEQHPEPTATDAEHH